MPDDGPWVDEALRIQTLNRNFDRQGARHLCPGPVPGCAELEDPCRRCAGTSFQGNYDLQPGDGDRLGRDHARPLRRALERAASASSTSRATSSRSTARTAPRSTPRATPTTTTPRARTRRRRRTRTSRLGVKFDLFEGNLSARAAIFKTTKYNERNRDSPDGVPLDDYLLSGKRHASGVDIDLAGRITPQWEVYVSYEWIPIAKIDEVQGVTLTGELEGQRPSMTPQHSGSLFDDLPGHPAAAPRRRADRAQLADAEPQPAGNRRAAASSADDLLASTRSRPRSSLKLNSGQRHQQALRRLALHGALHSRSGANPVRLR